MFYVTNGFIHVDLSFSGGWTLVDTQLNLNDPRLLSMAVTERYLQEANHDEDVHASASGAAFGFFVALFVSYCNYLV